MTSTTPPATSPIRPGTPAPPAAPAHPASAFAACTEVFRQTFGERRRSVYGYSIGLALLMLLMAAVYPSIKSTGEEFDAYAQSLPEGMRDAFGLASDSISSPPGYLMSQLYSNMFPLVLLVLGIAVAAWTIAGAEAEGTLELLLANPIRRVVAATGRVSGLWMIVAVVTIISTAVLQAISFPFGLDEGLPWWGVWSAGVAMYAMVMLHASVAFAVGAATGRRAWAITAAAVVAVVGFTLQLVASAADSLNWMREISPWWWLIDAKPLTNVPGWLDTGVPLLLSLVLTVVGVVMFNRRDLAA